MIRLVIRVAVAACVASAALPQLAAAAGGCPDSVEVDRSGTGELLWFGLFDDYEGQVPDTGTPVREDEETLLMGAIFTVPKGMTLRYTIRGLRHDFRGPGRWGMYCQRIRRPGTSRTAFVATQIWGGDVTLRGAAGTFNDAYITTPEGRVAMTARGPVRYRVGRDARRSRTLAQVLPGGGTVFVTATTGLRGATPCRQGRRVVIERTGRVRPA